MFKQDAPACSLPDKIMGDFNFLLHTISYYPDFLQGNVLLCQKKSLKRPTKILTRKLFFNA